MKKGEIKQIMEKINLKKILNNRTNLILLGILAVGLLIRIIFLYYFKDTVYFNPLLMDKHDQKTFMLWAQQIIKHPVFVDGKIFYMTPLYPYFLALLYKVFFSNLNLVIFFQLLMNIFLSFLLFYIGKKIYNEKVGLIAAFLSVFYRSSIVYASSVLSDSLIYFLFILFIVLIFYSLEKPNISRWVWSGIVLGLAALSKPTIAIYLPFLLLGLYLYPQKKLLPIKGSVKFQPLFVMLILLVVSGLTILPITLRNYFVGGEIVPICTNGLVNWQIGNSADSIGLFYYPKGELLSPLSFAFWKLFFMKLGLFFTSYEWPQNLDMYLLDKVIPFIRVAFVKFGFVFPLGMGGLIVLSIKNFKRNFIFTSYSIINVVWVTLFFIVDRFRLPAVGCFTVLSAYFIVWSIEKFKAKKVLIPILVWLGVGGFSSLFNIIPGPLIPKVSFETFAGLSVKNIEYALLKRDLGDGYRKAKAYYDFMPGDFRSNFMLACVLADMGKKEAATYYLEETIRINPGFEPAYKFLNDLQFSKRNFN